MHTLKTTFLSVLDYGDIIYKIAAPSALKPLDAVYHSALRWVTGDSYGTHHCTLYVNAGLPSLSERRELHWHLYIFKAITGKLPPYICNLLDHSQDPYRTRSNNVKTLKVPFARTELGKEAFSVSAPRAWNDLQKSLSITLMPSVGVFREMVSNTFNHDCNCF